MSEAAGPLVSTAWLAEHLDAPDVRVADASYYLPVEAKIGHEAYLKQHIPGAVFFDIDDIAESPGGLPHMLPSPETFSDKVGKLGLGDAVKVVIYDSRGVFSSPRVWWTFTVFGHKDVAVLDGGLPKWLAEGRPVEEGPVEPHERHFTARMNGLLLRELDQIQANLKSGREQLLDARDAKRFAGGGEEIWPGRRNGHIPGSRNLPFQQLFAADGTMLDPPQLAGRFCAAGIDLTKPVVTTCGSGITAAILSLGLALAGARNTALYDGSWAEWGLPEAEGKNERPIETGAPS
ncbi:MAG: sulfurtransferase [Rhodospirillales bacterium]|nr:sulfurtransferase [Rhodospirillales bacterium]